MLTSSVAPNGCNPEFPLLLRWHRVGIIGKMAASSAASSAEELASTLAALHVGPAREITPIVPDPPVNVQESLLMDEDIVEGILFGVTGRATRPAILEVQSITDTIVATLSAACERIWAHRSN